MRRHASSESSAYAIFAQPYLNRHQWLVTTISFAKSTGPSGRRRRRPRPDRPRRCPRLRDDFINGLLTEDRIDHATIRAETSCTTRGNHRSSCPPASAYHQPLAPSRNTPDRGACCRPVEKTVGQVYCITSDSADKPTRRGTDEAATQRRAARVVERPRVRLGQRQRRRSRIAAP